MVYYSNVFNFLIILTLSPSSFSNVEFATKPPENLKVFPSQNVSLQCNFTNLIQDHHIVEWGSFPDIENKQIISKNRQVIIEKIENVAEHYSILGDGMNYTLSIKMADSESLDFGASNNITTVYRCSVLEPSQPNPVITTATSVIIQKLPKPICGKINASFTVGETLSVGCYPLLFDPNVITNLKINGKALPIKSFPGFITHTLTITKEHHNAVFVCELKIRDTNETKSCSVGPITVNYKPEVTINKISKFEFRCTTEARPNVSLTHWIVEPTIPEDSFIISKDVLTFTTQLNIEFLNITCWANNSIGKTTKTLVVTDNQKEDDGYNFQSVLIISLSVILFVIILLMLICFLRHKRNKRRESTNKDTAHFKKEMNAKGNKPKQLVYDYAAVNINEYPIDYLEAENEMYIGGEVKSNPDLHSVPNKNIDNQKKKDEIYDEPNKGLEDERGNNLYSKINKPDYKECENEIYQGAGL